MKSWIFLLFNIYVACLCSCHKHAIKTSNSGAISQIAFVTLPPASKNIRFWDDGNNKMVTVSIEESEFLEMFQKLTFKEIAINDDVFYPSVGYGDVQNPPYKRPRDVKAKNGLQYRAWENNGGGVELIYDRDAKQAFIYYVGW